MIAGPTLVLERAVHIVQLESRYETIDELCVERLREFLAEHIEGKPGMRLLLDLSSTNFFGSSLVGLLFDFHKRLEAGGGKMALCCVAPYCLEVLQTVRFDTVCPIFESRAAAIEALEGDTPESG